ncbi:MAG: hypothetical protein ACKPKO_31605, partial [Candidatus Fonsibacter sp.]
MSHEITGGEIKAGNFREALVHLTNFWKYTRVKPDFDSNIAFEHWKTTWSESGVERNNFVFTPFSPEELWVATQKCRGKAPGPSGWTGSDLASWPLLAWTYMAKYIEYCMQIKKKVPEVWRQAMQVHIPKEDNNNIPEQMRPISLSCGILLLVTSSITRRPAFRE